MSVQLVVLPIVAAVSEQEQLQQPHVAFVIVAIAFAVVFEAGVVVAAAVVTVGVKLQKQLEFVEFLQ